MAQIRDEEELEDYIYEQFQKDFNPVNVGTAELFMSYSGKPFRQFHIKGYGTLDLLLCAVSDGNQKPLLSLRVIELKKNAIDYDAIGQICRYKTAIERYIDHLKLQKHCEVEITGLLIGHSFIASSDMGFILNQLDWLETYIYDLPLSGISFKYVPGPWRNTNEDFTSTQPAMKDFYLKELRPSIIDILRLKVKDRKGI